MNYLNLHTDILRSEAYLGAEPVERATWLNLIAWCCTQENGGIIPGAAAWGDRKWQQLCGVTKAEAHLASALYSFTPEGDMVVSFYPSEKENEVRGKRASGSKGGSRRTEEKAGAARENGGKGGRPPKPKQNPSENPTEGKGREGKENGKESECGETHPPTQASPGGESPSAVIPFHPLPDKDAVIASLNSCHPSWTSPELDGKEIKPFAESFAYLRSIPPDGWKVIGEFIRTPKQQGSAAWRPKNRLQLIDNIAEVDGYAKDWKRKQRPADSPSPKPAPSAPEEQPMTPEEIAEWIKSNPLAAAR